MQNRRIGAVKRHTSTEKLLRQREFHCTLLGSPVALLWQRPRCFPICRQRTSMLTARKSKIRWLIDTKFRKIAYTRRDLEMRQCEKHSQSAGHWRPHTYLKYNVRTTFVIYVLLSCMLPQTQDQTTFQKYTRDEFKRRIFTKGHAFSGHSDITNNFWIKAFKLSPQTENFMQRKN